MFFSVFVRTMTIILRWIPSNHTPWCQREKLCPHVLMAACQTSNFWTACRTLRKWCHLVTVSVSKRRECLMMRYVSELWPLDCDHIYNVLYVQVQIQDFCSTLEDFGVELVRCVSFQSEANEEDRLPASLPGGTTIVLQNPCLDNIRPNSPDTTSTYVNIIATGIVYI
jgi:hypothetical protein